MELPISDRLSESKFFYEQGLAHWRNGHCDLALSCLDECVRMGHPYFKAAALVTLGSVLSKIGDRERMMVYLRKIGELSEDEGKFVPRVVMGRTLTTLGEYDRAAEAYRRALNVQRPDPKLILNFAELELIRQKYDSAAELLSKLSYATEPNVVMMAAVLVIFLAALRGRYDEVSTPLKRVLRFLDARGVPADFRWDFSDISPSLEKITHPRVLYLIRQLVSALSRRINVEDFLHEFPALPKEKPALTVKV